MVSKKKEIEIETPVKDLPSLTGLKLSDDVRGSLNEQITNTIKGSIQTLADRVAGAVLTDESNGYFMFNKNRKFEVSTVTHGKRIKISVEVISE